jgi:hypothetical protein
MRIACRLALLLAAMPLLLGADVYRWVDADGIVNYSQRKPEGVSSDRLRAATGEPVRADAPAPAPAPAPSGQPAADGAGGRPGNVEPQPAAPSPQELARQRADACDSARAVLEQLTSRGRVRIRDEDGSARMLTEEERQERIAHAQGSVASFCAGTASR